MHQANSPPMNETPTAFPQLPSDANTSAATMTVHRLANVSTPPKGHA
jgi:hypothetical protein